MAVNPKILRWARETAGLALDDAAQKLQLVGNASSTGVERLAALEDGKTEPSRTLLLAMAKQYRRPLLVFYLAEPPTRGDRGEDFRRLPDDYSPKEEGLVDALLRDIRARQGIVRAVLEDEEEADPLEFVGSLNFDAGTEIASKRIIERLGFDLNVFRQQQNIGDAFAYLRSCVESIGIFVLIVGDLGSHHTRISVESFRGFAIADDVAPFVVINDQDARAAWSFTLLHEVAHVWLGQSGVSGAFADTSAEKFCNDVAGRILLPFSELTTLDVRGIVSLGAVVELIDEFADTRKISRAMVAYSLFSTGVISREKWEQLRAAFRQQWLDYKAQKRERDNKNGGPSYYVVRRYRAGGALIRLMARMSKSGAISPTKAGRVLGVQARNVFELLQQSA